MALVLQPVTPWPQGSSIFIIGRILYRLSRFIEGILFKFYNIMHLIGFVVDIFFYPASPPETFDRGMDKWIFYHQLLDDMRKQYQTFVASSIA